MQFPRSIIIHAPFKERGTFGRGALLRSGIGREFLLDGAQALNPVSGDGPGNLRLAGRQSRCQRMMSRIRSHARGDIQLGLQDAAFGAGWARERSRAIWRLDFILSVRICLAEIAHSISSRHDRPTHAIWVRCGDDAPRGSYLSQRIQFAMGEPEVESRRGKNDL